MAQVKIYGLKDSLDIIKHKLSDVIHQCIVDSLSFPPEKRFHRFIAFNNDDMIFPDDKSKHYTIIEIMMMEGRTTQTKKGLIQSLFKSIQQELHIESNDIEICIIESPASNWGFRGMTGDEIKLNYKVEV